MKLLKSQCGKAWLFDVRRDDDMLFVGFACFLAQCPMQVKMVVDDKFWHVLLPVKAVESPVPTRMVGARLSLVSEST